MIPKNKQKSGVNRRDTQNKRSGQSHNKVDQLILTSHKSAASAFAETILADLHLRPPTVGITQHPPLNYRNMIYWAEDNTDIGITYPSGGTTFSALSFQLSDMFTLPTLSENFDQYCLYSVLARFTFEVSNSGVLPGEFLSAIDFDSATVPTGPGALEAYSSFEVLPIVQGATQTRFIKPCVTPFVFQSGTLVTSFAVSRQWIDCADLSVPHFGIKFGLKGNTSPVICRVFLTYVVGFKNKL